MSDLVRSRVYLDVDDPDLPLEPLVASIEQGMKLVLDGDQFGLKSFQVEAAPRLSRVLVQLTVDCPAESEVEEHVTEVIRAALSHMGEVEIGGSGDKDPARHLAEGSAEYAFA